MHGHIKLIDIIICKVPVSFVMMVMLKTAEL